MRVLLVNVPHPAIGSRIPDDHLPPLGLLAIGGPLLDDGHRVRLIDGEFGPMALADLVEEAVAWVPDAVLFGHSGSPMIPRKSPAPSPPVVRVVYAASAQPTIMTWHTKYDIPDTSARSRAGTTSTARHAGRVLPADLRRGRTRTDAWPRMTTTAQRAGIAADVQEFLGVVSALLARSQHRSRAAGAHRHANSRGASKIYLDVGASQGDIVYFFTSEQGAELIH